MDLPWEKRDGFGDGGSMGAPEPVPVFPRRAQGCGDLARAGSPELGLVLIFGCFLLFLPPLPREGFKLFLCPRAISVLLSGFLLRHWHYLQQGWCRG